MSAKPYSAEWWLDQAHQCILELVDELAEVKRERDHLKRIFDAVEAAITDRHRGGPSCPFGMCEGECQEDHDEEEDEEPLRFTAKLPEGLAERLRREAHRPPPLGVA